MKYLCLRDCFVGGIYWVKGKVYELPDELEKSPKNFKALEEAKTEEPVKTSEPEPVVPEAPVETPIETPASTEIEEE